MATGKKSFILYCDQKGLWDKLDNEQAGKLIKHILSYVNDDNPEEPDFVTGLAFEPIKQQLKRDLKKWEKQHEQRVKAGKASAEKRKRNPTTVDERSVSSTVNGNVNVNASVSVNANEKNIKATPKNKLVLWIEQNAPRVQKLKEPITNEQAEKIKLEFQQDVIIEVFTAMHNHKDINKKISANLTFRNWASRRDTKPTEKFIPEPPKL